MDPIDDLGLQIFLYKPQAGTFDELTAGVGAGFGNYREKYAWSASLFDGSDADDIPELYVTPLNSRSDFVGLITAGLTLDTLFSTGALPLREFVGFSSPAFQELLADDFPNLINSQGPSVWRYDFPSASWDKVFDVAASNGDLDDGDIGFRDSVVFDDRLYLASSSSLVFNVISGGENEAKMFVSSDGETFTRLTGGPLDPAEGNTSIRALTTVKTGPGPDDTALLVGTGNIKDGAQAWLYGTDGSWSELARFDDADEPFAATISEAIQFEVDGELKTYLGSWFPYGVLEIDLETGEATDVGPPPPPPGPFSDPDNGIMQFAVFDGYLYAGSVDYAGGASLYRTTDPEAGWEAITTDGFETELPDYYGFDETDTAEPPVYIWSLEAIGDALYIGDFNPVQGTLLKLTHDAADDVTVEVVPSAENPQQFGSVGIGLRKFVPVDLGGDGLPTAAQETPDALIIGSADDAQSLGDASPLDPLFSPTGAFVVGASPSGETLTGTMLEDVILGGLGADVIDGGDEDDIVIADLFGAGLGGSDTVDGGEGDDIVLGNAGSDAIDGGTGEDLLIGGLGRDSIRGGDGIDLIVGDAATDIPIPDFSSPNLGMNAAPDDGPAMPTADDPSDGAFGGLLPGLGGLLGNLGDAALGALGLFGRLNDRIDAGAGNDVVLAGGGRDLVLGRSGKDFLFGDDGHDRLFGGTGKDILDGGAGNDVVRGQAGDDVILTGLGNDRLIGNDGNDRFLVIGAEGADVVDTGEDVIRGFRKGEDVIDLSAFFQPPNPFVPPVAPDFAALAAAALSTTAAGWLAIDVSALGGTVAGAGTVVVRGLRFEDAEASDFLFDTVLTPEFDASGFF